MGNQGRELAVAVFGSTWLHPLFYVVIDGPGVRKESKVLVQRRSPERLCPKRTLRTASIDDGNHCCNQSGQSLVFNVHSFVHVSTSSKHKTWI